MNSDSELTHLHRALLGGGIRINSDNYAYLRTLRSRLSYLRSRDRARFGHLVLALRPTYLEIRNHSAGLAALEDIFQ